MSAPLHYIFGEGGGRRVAESLGVDFLGEVPIDPRVVEGGDQGKPILTYASDSQAAGAFRNLAGTVALSDYDAAPDGQSFVMFPGISTGIANNNVTLVLNWFEELKQRVPTGR